MTDRLTNLSPNLLDATRHASLDAPGVQGNAPETADLDWFLPGNSVGLGTINAIVNPDLQGATPESAADRVLSHIGV